MKTRQKTQAERLAEKLSEIRIDLAPSDRSAAVEALSVTPETISRYLNGKVGENDFAVKLITFFKNRIEEREKAIAL